MNQSEKSKERMGQLAREYNATKFGSKIDFKAGYIAGMSDPESNWQANLKVEHGPLSEVKENEKLRELLEECEKAFESIVDKEGYRYSYIHSTDKEIAEAMLKKLRERKGGG